MKLQKSIAIFLSGVLCAILVSGCGNKTELSQTTETKEPKKIEVTKAPISDGMVINCWGDSLTAGTAYENQLSYPKALQNALSDYQVNNFGIGGEGTKTILQRMGASPIMVGLTTQQEEKFSLPADSQESEQFSILDNDGNEAGILKQVQEDTGEDCINPVIVDGMECTLSKRGYFYCLSRNDSKEEVTIKSGTTIIPNAAFGEHFYDFRSYVLKRGLKDAGIKATKKDKKDIKDGEIPRSFMKAPDPDVDHVHGNEAFFQLLSNELVKKLKELQYI